MSFFKRLFHRPSDPRQSMAPLYAAVVTKGRAVHWYAQGNVPDTLDGRFDMIAAVMSLVLLRLDSQQRPQESVWLTELFVDDMDAQLRQLGVGDVVVGKHIGRMMSALGGRISAYRAAMLPDGDLKDALARNLYRGEAVEAPALELVASRLRALATALENHPVERLLAGDLPE
jgi:cytochrome b pre-mRNA-processing protein 3